jgi:hypothetical protein
MQRLHFAIVFALVAVAGVAYGNPPEVLRTEGTTYTLTDEPSPVASDIVWGPTSDDHRSCDHYHAGCPQCLRKFTIPSNTRHYGGYYVGGGTPTRGAGRCNEEGTWGWDYSGVLFPKRIALNWSAKGLYQGGTGTYKTDGPKLRKE